MPEATLSRSAAKPESSLLRSRILCGAAVVLYWATLELYLPTLPTYIADKTGALSQVGVILSMYGLCQALVRFPLGIASDWVGRRKVFVVVGLALAGVGALILGRAEGVAGLYLGRIITGVAAATWVPLLVMFTALFPPEESVRASAMITLISSAARAAATGGTGWLNDWGGYGLAFRLAAGLAVLGILLILPSRDPRRVPRTPHPGTLLRLITRSDVLLPSLLALASQFAMWGTTFAFNPIMARQLGASDRTLGLLMSLNAVAMLGGSMVATAGAHRFGGRALSYAGLIMQSVGVAVIALAPSVAVVLVAQAIIGLSQGISYPVLMGLSIRHVDEGQRTSAMGLHQTIYALGMFGGPAVCGVLADAVGIRPMFAIIAGLALVAALGLMRLYVRHVPETG